MDEELAKPWSPFELDTNGDGVFTISDLQIWVVDVFFVPGDWLIWFMSERLPAVAQFLELGTDDYGGLVSALLSGFAWLAAFIAVMIVYHGVRRFDQLLTMRVAQAWEETLRRTRLTWQLLKHKLAWRFRSARADAIEVSDGIDVDALERALLIAHAEIEPPYALTLSDAARAVGRRRHETERKLERLLKLGLLERSTAGAEDGEAAYMLSRSGRAMMVLERLAGPRSRTRAPSGV